MRICKNCGQRMIQTYHFEKKKCYIFEQCRKCHNRSKCTKLDTRTLHFENCEEKAYEKR